MRITFFLPGIGLGGGARVVFEYANRLTGRGHKVCIVYPLLSLELKHKMSFSGIVRDAGAIKNFYKGRSVSWFDLKARIVRVPSLRPGHIRLFERMIPDSDVVIATSKETAEPVSLLSKKKGEKFYFIQQYEIWDIWDNEVCWKEAEKVADDNNKLCLAMVDVIPDDKALREYKALVDRTYKLKLRKITISSWLKEMLESKFNESVEGMIINGVNFDMFHGDPSERTGNPVSVLMPYRPYKNKGTDDGMNALLIAKQKFPDTKFLLYGDNGDAKLPEWVDFYGSIPDDELRKLYCSADIFVSPNWTEGCQLPPMEAMACGCAVVSTSVGGVPDYSINGETILTSPPRDVNSMASNLLRMIGDASERKKIALGGHKYIQRFTWDKATDELEGILMKYANVARRETAR